MKYYLIILAIVLNPLTSSSQDTSYYDTEWKTCDKNIASYSRIVKMGNSGYRVKDYFYPSMVLQMTGTYEDKKLNYKTGEFSYYSNEGKPMYYANYEKDKINGWYVTCDKNGYPNDSSFYKMEVELTVKKYYHKNKYLLYVQNYKNNLLNDTTFTYFPNGMVKRIEVYKDGEIEIGYCLDSNEKKIPYTPLFIIAKFPGGQTKMNEWLSSNIIYPLSKQNEGIEGNVIVSFIIDTLGKPKNYVMVNSSDKAFSEATKYLIDIMPNWSPAYLDGEKFELKVTQPISFKLDDKYTTKNTFQEINELYINGEPVYHEVDEMPEFIGGDIKMFEYIKANLNYPALASENGIDGTSMVSFIVLSNGDLTRIKTNRSAGWNLDEEAIRIIKSMPKWKPGKMDGIPVNVRISIPVKFRIKQD